MKHFLSTDTNKVFAYANDEERAQWGSGSLVAISDAELQSILNPIPSLQEEREKRWKLIQAYRDERTSSGGYKVGDYWFHSDMPSRIQQIGLVMLAANIPVGLQWKTMDGRFVSMTAELAGAVFAAAAASDIAIFAAAELHKAAMEASDNPSNYDFSAGWPPVFGD